MSAPVITFRLSKIGKVREYLAALPLNVRPLRDGLQAAEDKVAVLQATYDEAAAKDAHAKAQYKAARAVKEAEVAAANKRFAPFCLEFADGTVIEPTDHRNPESKHYNLEAANAQDERNRLLDELYAMTSPYGSAHKIEASLRMAKSDADHARSVVESVEEHIREAAEQLPNGAASLGRDALERISKVTIESLGEGFDLAGHWPDASHAEIAGMIRGELPIDCDGCEDGYIWLKLKDIEDVKLVLDDEVRHHACEARASWSDGCLTGAVPPKFAAHRVHCLGAYSKSPINPEVQRYSIGKIPSMVDGLNGWLMFGRAGTSKSTFAASAITDMLTFRAVIYANPRDIWRRLSSTAGISDLNYWRVKVPKWIQDTEAFKNRDFGDQSVPEPELTPHAIEEATDRTDLPPVLWMEELDKIGPTEARLRYLYCLVDAVYESGGMIVATSNMKPGELKKHLGEPVYRRISGENDPDGTYLVWDFWKMERMSPADLQKLKDRSGELSLSIGPCGKYDLGERWRG